MATIALKHRKDMRIKVTLFKSPVALVVHDSGDKGFESDAGEMKMKIKYQFLQHPFTLFFFFFCINRLCPGLIDICISSLQSLRCRC